MWTIIIQAIVALLIAFFEQWWKDSYPFHPAQYRTTFVDRIGSIRYFWLGPDRAKYADALFTKFAANYDANPPAKNAFDGKPMDGAYAAYYAKKYALGLTLFNSEIYDKAKGNC